MRVKINRENCIGCGSCQAIAPEVFELDNEGFATVKVDEVNEEFEEDVTDAVEGCPTSAIENAE